MYLRDDIVNYGNRANLKAFLKPAHEIMRKADVFSVVLSLCHRNLWNGGGAKLGLNFTRPFRGWDLLGGGWSQYISTLVVIQLSFWNET